MSRWVLEVPGLPRLQGDVVHWRIRQKERKGWHRTVGWAVKACGVPPPSVTLRRARVIVTRYSAANQSPDYDNLAYGAKPLIDGLIGLLIVDDKPEHAHVDYHWEKCKRGQGRVRIVVEAETGEDRCPTCGGPLPAR